MIKLNKITTYIYCLRYMFLPVLCQNLVFIDICRGLFFAFNDLRLDVGYRVVDISGIVDHHCLHVHCCFSGLNL